MHNNATQIADEIAVLDHRIQSLRAELTDLKERRAALVDTLAGELGAEHVTGFRTPHGTVSLKHRNKVVFPTQSSDPRGQEGMIKTIRDCGVWMNYSTVNYSRLKSGWLTRKMEHSLRSALRPFAHENIELVVTCPR